MKKAPKSDLGLFHLWTCTPAQADIFLSRAASAAQTVSASAPMRYRLPPIPVCGETTGLSTGAGSIPSGLLTSPSAKATADMKLSAKMRTSSSATYFYMVKPTSFVDKWIIYDLLPTVNRKQKGNKQS